MNEATYKEPLCEYLYLQRTSRDYSTSEISKLIGISQSYYCKIESGEKQPTVQTLFKIALFYHASMMKLVRLLLKLDDGFDQLSPAQILASCDEDPVSDEAKTAQHRRSVDDIMQELQQLTDNEYGVCDSLFKKIRD